MVRGPAKVQVDGNCHVLGNDVSGQQVSVRAGKVLPFEPNGKCKINVALGDGGEVWEDDKAGVSMWQEVAGQIFRKNLKTVMLVGDSDTGKSTLSAYLVNLALQRGLRPCIIDGDIGQTDLGPPTTIGAAAIDQQITDLRDVKAELFEFIGNMTPVGYYGYAVVKGLGSILKKIRHKGDICIINTDGYVRNGGVDYKIRIAKELKPDAIICFDKFLYKIFKIKFRSTNVLRARPFGQVFKSRSERIERRHEQYLRYLEQAKLVSKDLKEVRFVYRGKILSAQEYFARHDIEEGTFVGLGSKGRVTGFGVVKDVTPRMISIDTPVQNFHRIYVSNVMLD